MLIRHIEEELALAAIFEPYLEAGKLRENAPQAAKDALKRYLEMIKEHRREVFEATYGWSYDG